MLDSIWGDWLKQVDELFRDTTLNLDSNVCG